MKKAKKQQDGIKIKGMFRVHIEEDGKIVGDSGWKTNQVTNLGFNYNLCALLGASSTSRQITHMALGFGTGPAATATSALQSEAASRVAVTVASSTGSKTLRCTATFNSSINFIAAASTLQNIGLFNDLASSATTNQIFAGNTYATSAIATNQSVNCTYDIIFA